MNREEAKALIREVLTNFDIPPPSFLAISAQLGLEARFVLELVRELQVEFEAEMWTMLVES